MGTTDGKVIFIGGLCPKFPYGSSVHSRTLGSYMVSPLWVRINIVLPCILDGGYSA